MAIILASGTATGNSTDIVIASGALATVFLTDAAGPTVHPDTPQCPVQIKTAGGEYNTIGFLDKGNLWSLSITSPGTFRVVRPDVATAVAIEQT